MTEKPSTTFAVERSLASPEAAARELLRIYRTMLNDGATHTYTGVTNSEFIYQSSGSVAEHIAGRAFGFAQKWFRFDDSGTRVFLLPDSEDA